MIQRTGQHASLAIQMAFTKLSHWARSPFLSADERRKSFEAMEESLAETLCEHLAHLRGTAAKLGQVLAMESGLVSERFTARLQTLQHATLPLRYPVVRKVIERDLGKPPEALFREFSPDAFASASMGQVHRAVLPSGEVVAVKILFPGVAKSVETDFALVRALVSPLKNNKLFMRTLDEIQARIGEELDFRNELASLSWFGALEMPPGLRLPRVYPELSGAQVLTSECLSGEPLSRVRPATREERDLAGQIIFDFFRKSLLDWKAIHADPHAGNYLWSKEKREVGLVDFGAVKKDFSPEVLTLFGGFFGELPKDLTLDLYQRLGAEIDDGDHFHTSVVVPYRENVRRLLDSPRYTFSASDDLAKQLRLSLMAHAFHPGLQNLSIEFTSLHRTFYGVLTLLHKLEATIEPRW